MLDHYMTANQDETESRMRDHLVDAERQILKLTDELEHAKRQETASTERMVTAEAKQRVAELAHLQLSHEVDRLKSTNHGLETQVEMWRGRATLAESRLAEITLDNTTLKRNLDAAERHLEDSRREGHVVEDRVAALIERIKAGDEENLKLKEAEHQLRTDAAGAKDDAARMQAQCDRLRQDLQGLTQRCSDAEREAKEQRLDLALARTKSNEMERDRVTLEGEISQSTRTTSQLRNESAEWKRRATLLESQLQWADDDRGTLLALWHTADRERLAAAHGRDMLRERIDDMQAQDIVRRGRSGPTADELAHTNALLQARVAELYFTSTWHGEAVGRGFHAASEGRERTELLKQRCAAAEQQAVRADTYADACNQRAAVADHTAKVKVEEAVKAQAAVDDAKKSYDRMKLQVDASSRTFTELIEARDRAALREATALQSDRVASLRAAAAEKAAHRAQEDKVAAERRAQDALTIAEHKSAIARDAEHRVATVDQRIAEATEQRIEAEARMHGSAAEAEAMRLRATALDEQISVLLARCSDAEGHAHHAEQRRREAEAHTYTADTEAAAAVNAATASRAAEAEALAARRNSDAHAAAMTSRCAVAEERAGRLAIELDAAKARVEQLDGRCLTAEAVADHLSHKCKMFEREAMAAQRRAHDIQRLTSGVQSDEIAAVHRRFDEQLADATKHREELLEEIVGHKKRAASAELAAEQRAKQVSLLRGEVALLRDTLEHSGGTRATGGLPQPVHEADLASVASMQLGSTLGGGGGGRGTIRDDDQQSVAGSLAGFGAPMSVLANTAAEVHSLSGVELQEEHGRGMLVRLEASYFMRVQGLRAHEAEVICRYLAKRLAALQIQLSDTELEAQTSKQRDTAVVASARSADERCKTAVRQLLDCEERLHHIQAMHADLVNVVHRVVRLVEMPQDAAAALIAAARSADGGTAPAYEAHGHDYATSTSGATEVEVASLRQETRAQAQELTALRNQLNVAERESAEQRKMLRELERRVAEARAAQADAEGHAEEAQVVARRHRDGSAQAEQAVARLRDELALCETNADGLRDALAQQSKAIDEMQTALEQRISRTDTLETDLARLNARLARCTTAELEALKESARQALVAEAMQEKVAVGASAVTSLMPILRLHAYGLVDAVEQRLMQAEYENARLRRMAETPAPQPELIEKAQLRHAGVQVNSAIGRGPRRGIAAVRTPPAAGAFQFRIASTRGDRGSEDEDGYDDGAPEGIGTPTQIGPAAFSRPQLASGDHAAMSTIAASYDTWLRGVTYEAFDTLRQTAELMSDSLQKACESSVADRARAAAAALDDAAAARRNVKAVDRELADANDALLVSVKRVRELEQTAATLDRELSECTRARVELEATVRQLTNNEAAAHRRIQTVEDELTSQRFTMSRAPLVQADVEEAAWSQLSDTQRRVLESAMQYEQRCGDLETRNRDLEKRAGTLERNAAHSEKQAQTALAAERQAHTAIAELNRALQRKEAELKAVQDDVASAMGIAQRARDAEAESRGLATKLQTRMRDMEMAHRMQKFLREQEASHHSIIASRLTAADEQDSGADLSSHAMALSPIQPSSLLREAIHLCASPTPPRSDAPSTALPGGGAAKPRIATLAELTGAAPPAGAAAGAESSRVSDVAAALQVVAEEVRRVSVQQRQAESMRREAEAAAAREENLTSLADLRDLLISRAEALRRQEMALREYQVRFKTFENAVDARLKALAREERMARFDRAMAEEHSHDLLRLAHTAIKHRRRARKQLRAHESAAMARLDRSSHSTSTQTDASATTEMLNRLRTGVALASPRRFRGPLGALQRRQQAMQRRLIENRSAILAVIALAGIIGIIVWLVLTSEDDLTQTNAAVNEL
jgi:chromosome segregation ATPase